MVRFDGIKSYYDFRQVSSDQLKTDAQKLIDVRIFSFDKQHFLTRLSLAGLQGSLWLCGQGGCRRREFLLCDPASAQCWLWLCSLGRGSAAAGMVATDKALRDASSDAEKMLEEFEVEMSMRKDVFDNILAFSKSDERSPSWWSQEGQDQGREEVDLRVGCRVQQEP